MHIYEGVLSATAHGQQVLLAGAAATTIGTAIGLYKMDYERIPRVAVLSSAFFVASLIQVPLLGSASSVHLVLGGLMGLVLGWSAFPAVLVALVLQTAFYTPAGPVTLGLNTLIMALPAVICYYLFHTAACSAWRPMVFAAGFAAGATAIVLGAMLSAGSLLLAGKEYEALAPLFLAVHLPVAVIEGLVTGSVVVLLRQVRPEAIGAPMLIPAIQEAVDG